MGHQGRVEVAMSKKKVLAHNVNVRNDMAQDHKEPPQVAWESRNADCVSVMAMKEEQSHHSCMDEKKQDFFANSSFLIFRTANRNGKALSDPKGVQLMRRETPVLEK